MYTYIYIYMYVQISTITCAKVCGCRNNMNLWTVAVWGLQNNKAYLSYIYHTQIYVSLSAELSRTVLRSAMLSCAVLSCCVVLCCDVLCCTLQLKFSFGFSDMSSNTLSLYLVFFYYFQKQLVERLWFTRDSKNQFWKGKRFWYMVSWGIVASRVISGSEISLS